MLLLSRLIGVGILIWFYVAGKNQGEPPFKWAILGFIGYWLTWFIVSLTVVKSLSGLIQGSFVMAFIINLIPAIVGVVACFFIKKRLTATAVANK